MGGEMSSSQSEQQSTNQSETRSGNPSVGLREAVAPIFRSIKNFLLMHGGILNQNLPSKLLQQEMEGDTKEKEEHERQRELFRQQQLEGANRNTEKHTALTPAQAGELKNGTHGLTQEQIANLTPEQALTLYTEAQADITKKRLSQVRDKIQEIAPKDDQQATQLPKAA